MICVWFYYIVGIIFENIAIKNKCKLRYISVLIKTSIDNLRGIYRQTRTKTNIKHNNQMIFCLHEIQFNLMLVIISYLLRLDEGC